MRSDERAVPPHPPPHPGPEAIAALLDRRLAPAERRSLTEHLANCEDCYDLFAESLRDLEEIGTYPREEPPGPARVLRFRRLGWWPTAMALGSVAAAAAVVLVVSDGPSFPIESTPRLPLSLIAASVPPAGAGPSQNPADFRPQSWTIYRGERPRPETAARSSFQTGVLMVRLQVELVAGRRDTASAVSREIAQALQPLEMSAPFRAYFVGRDSIADRLDSGEPISAARSLLLEADSVLGPDQGSGDPGYLDPLRYALGKWAVAAELNLQGLDWSFFNSPSSRLLLRQALAADLPSALVSAVKDVRMQLDIAGARPDPTRLRRSLARLIEVGGM